MAAVAWTAAIFALSGWRSAGRRRVDQSGRSLRPRLLTGVPEFEPPRPATEVGK